MNFIPIDELIEAWVRARQEAHDDDWSWLREACQHLRPTPEDGDEEEKRQGG